ncbi:MAG: hypothetical protein V1791_10025 [Pseudomonadota bacterium]
MLIAGVVTSLSLGILTIRAGQISMSRTIADNLAREGIEQVRAIRDSNWLADQNAVDEDENPTWRWDAGLCDASDPLDQLAILDMGEGYGAFSLQWGLTNTTDPRTRIYEINNKQQHINYYMQSMTEPVTTEPDFIVTRTPFSRHLFIMGNKLCDGSSPQYTVESVVSWVEYGTKHESILQEDLYNWRP